MNNITNIMKKILIICISLIGFSLCVFAQQNAQAQQTLEISGVVRDGANEPLIGVSISVADAAGLGTITDVDGKYKIKVQRYQKLIFSYIGFEKVEMVVTNKKDIDIVMREADSSVLKEVVVTGTGLETKETVTGAITTVNVGDLKANPTSSLSNALAGNVAGILAFQSSGQPGQNVSEFWIRGISTFGGGTEPYILVDGFERDLNDLNIEDIETFTVLKDASVTAIYGSKGANGVILITTKQGKSGKIDISVKVETMYNTRTKTPEFVDGLTYANLINEARHTRNMSTYYQPEELEMIRLGLDQDLYPNVDWSDILLKDGAMTYRANVNLRGGGATSRYFASVSYLDEGGMYKTDKTLRDQYDTNANFKRWNYRLNTEIDITKTTLLTLGVGGFLSKRNSPGLGDNDLWAMLFGYSAIRVPLMYSNGYVPAVTTAGRSNPWVVATQTGYNENWRNTINTNATLEQKLDFITKGLKFTGRFGFDTLNKNNIRRRKSPELWYAGRARGTNGELLFTKVLDPSEMTQSSDSEGERREFLDIMLNYNGKIGQHRFGATLKYTQDAKIQTVNLGDDLKNGISRRNQALAGRVTYNWKLRYFADFIFGYTGSENFATGHQYGFFPAFSGGWNISEEKFIKNNIKWMDMLKIRYSWGKVGNDNLKIQGEANAERFPFLYTIKDEGENYQWADYGDNNSYKGFKYTQVASPYVTWEVATKQDLGLDIALFNNKFSANVDYFHEKREGIYMIRNYLPQMVGLEGRNPRANVGKVKSEGFDGRFSYNQKINNVNLTVRGNMTYSKNTVLEKDESYNVYPYQYEAGQRVGQTRGLIALGLFKDYEDIRNSPEQKFGDYQPGDIKYKDVNGDGVINGSDVVAIGATKKPNLIYGLGASASWKGLDFSVHFQGSGKSNFFVDGKASLAFKEGQWGNILKDTFGPNRWIAADISGDPATEDPNASYPRLSFSGNANNHQNSTFWLRNGQYLRLKTIDIGYSLPRRLVNKIHCNNIRVFFVGTNLLTFSSFKMWDPELGSNNGEQYPLAKTLTLGITVKL